MATRGSEKHALIDKARSSLVLVIAVAVSLVVFSAFFTRSLIIVASHRSKVISEKRAVAKTLKANDVEVGKLIDSFIAFDNTTESIMKVPDGQAPVDEKNSKIVLDALPPQYDFPALATSLESILSGGGYTITGISGIDNELAEADDNTSAPEPVEIPFSISVSGPYDKIKSLPVDLERSIRPMYVTNVEISGSASEARMTINAKTYYQPGKNLEVRFKEVK